MLSKTTQRNITRALLPVLFRPLIVWTVLCRTWNEIRYIPFLCWLDIRGEWASAKRLWSGEGRKVRNR